MAFAGNDRFVTATPSGQVALWRVRASPPLVSVRRGPAIRALGVRADGHELAVSDLKRPRIRLLDTRSYRSHRELTLPAPFTAVVALAISPDGRFVAAITPDLRDQGLADPYTVTNNFKPRVHPLDSGGAAEEDTTPPPAPPVVLLWDTQTGKRTTLRTNIAEPTAVAFDRPGDALAVGGVHGSITLWRIESGRLVRQPPLCAPGAPAASLTALDFSGDGRSLYAVHGGTVMRFRVGTREILERHPLRGTGVSIAGSARLAATFERDGSVAFHRLPSWQKLGTRIQGGADSLREAALSTDGRLLAIDDTTSLSIWDATSGSRIGRIPNSCIPDPSVLQPTNACAPAPSMLSPANVSVLKLIDPSDGEGGPGLAWTGQRLVWRAGQGLQEWDPSLVSMRRYACAIVNPDRIQTVLGNRKNPRLCD